MLALRWILSLIFNIQMYVAMVVVGVVYLPAAIINRDYATSAARAYCNWVRFSLRILCGLRTEIRGTPPTGAALIASKHHSFLDVIMIYTALPRGRYIMKDMLRYAPVLGWYALRMGCIPIKRGGRGSAITKMVEDVKAGHERPGQLIIYPQGTRTAPGEKKPYKTGTAALYAQLQQPCYPVAINIAIFWPKRGVMRKPGLAVVEFLPPIAPGLSNAVFMAELEQAIETQSNVLMAEAGWKGL
jgi:1-acyl-sn-glycerol-3-phosphate acyltransferase